MAVAVCDRAEPMSTERPIQQSGENSAPGYTVTKPEDAMPYGENYKDLANKPPQQVAEKALTNLAEAGPQELDDGSAYQQLRGILTPE